jgi:hypothetical protein
MHMPSPDEWKQAKKLTPTQMISHAFIIAFWEAQDRGDITKELSEIIVGRADDLIQALVKGKAIVKNKETGFYDIVDRPEDPALNNDVLVIKPKGE